MRNSGNLYEYISEFKPGGYGRRIFWGSKFSIPGFLGVGKFGKHFFGWLDLSSDFFGYSE